MSPRPLAERIVAQLALRGERVVLAESLTGGLLTSALVDVSGASAVVTGGVVAYATELKSTLLDVDAVLLAERGAVDAEVAVQMAHGVRERLALDGRPADHALATTGVAGPEPQDGHPAGTVWIALSSDAGDDVRSLFIVGDRQAVREATVDAALELLAQRLGIDARE
jgi:nicotinamide-nucleotide amidase